MANLFAWLMAAVWPLAKKVLVMLGIGMVTYGAISTLIASVVSQVQSSWGGVTGVVLQLCSLGGIPEVLGIITGAFVARGTFLAVGQLTKLSSP